MAVTASAFLSRLSSIFLRISLFLPLSPGGSESPAAAMEVTAQNNYTHYFFVGGEEGF